MNEDNEMVIPEWFLSEPDGKVRASRAWHELECADGLVARIKQALALAERDAKQALDLVILSHVPFEIVQSFEEARKNLEKAREDLRGKEKRLEEIDAQYLDQLGYIPN